MKKTCDRRTPFPTHLMHQMLRTLSILVLIILLSIFGTAPSGHASPIVNDDVNGGAIDQGLSQINDPSGTGAVISYGGTLTDKIGTAIGQATVEVAGANPPITTQTNVSGVFDLQGVPAGNPFVLKFSKAGYLPTYSAVLSSNANMQGNYTLFATRGEVNALWTSQGAIWGRVRNRNDNSTVGGATVVATSTLFPGTTYLVYYCNDAGTCRTGQGTYGNGRFLIRNAPEDTVIVQAFQDGWSFDPRAIHIFADGVANQGTNGIPTASNITFAGYVKDNANAVLPGVTAQMVGNGAVTATTDGSGYFNVAGLPNNAGFYMRYSKAGYIPVYTEIMSVTGPIYLTGAATLFRSGQFPPIVAGKSSIAGMVVNRTTGAPVGGAVVTLHSAKSPSGNAYVVNYCTNAGTCRTDQGTYSSNGAFDIFNVDAGDVIVVRAEKNGWDFSDGDSVLVTFADAISELLQSGMRRRITPTGAWQLLLLN